jgi:Flp pilus assembly protein TadD
LATYVVARLEAKAGRPEKAVDLLEKCLDREAPEPRVLNLLAGLHLKAERFDEAARLYQLGAQRDPHNSRWWKALARVYLTSGDENRLAPVLARLAETEPDDLAVRKKLAEIARAREDFDSVGVWANRALEIDVSDAELHRMIAEAALRGHNLPEAIEEFRTAVELGDESPSVRVGLAKSLWAAGRRAEARQELDALLEREPDHSEAGSLRSKWEENGQE